MTKESNARATEKEFRSSRYSEIENELLAVNHEVTMTKNETVIQELKIEDPDEILKTLKLYFRDKVRFTIIDKEKHRHIDNTLLDVSNDKLVISNPFVTYANKMFPNVVLCTYEEEGTEYSFTLEKIKNNDNSISVGCYIPSVINVLKRRGNSRYSPNEYTSIGVFFKEKDKEIIGRLTDVSNVGVGMSFQESSLDNEILSYISENKNKTFSIIIDDNGEYFTMLINIKYLFQNRKDQVVNLGAEFLFLEGEEEEEKQKHLLAGFFKRIKKEHLDRKTKEKTTRLILSSKMGVKF